MQNHTQDIEKISNLLLLQGIVIESLLRHTGAQSTAMEAMPGATDDVEVILGRTQEL